MGGRLVATGYRTRGEGGSERIGKLKAQINKIKWEATSWLLAGRFIVVPWVKAQRHGRSLERVSGPAAVAGSRALVVVAPFYGEEHLLEIFLDHHRKLGADIFVFLDLSAEGGLGSRLEAESDCAVWRPIGEPRPDKAIYWLNYLRQRYADGHWCLSLEICDLFVFPRYETRQIKDLLDFLDTERRDHLYAVVIEMYGDRPASELAAEPAGSPLQAMPYFDPVGYSVSPRVGRFRNVAMRGGMQRRTLFREQPPRAPAIDRVPLVKWRRHYGYITSTRTLMPRVLNKPHPRPHSSPTAALLRFALLEEPRWMALADQVEAGDIVAGRGARSYARLPELRDRIIRHEHSRAFTTSWDLVEFGLLNPGQWF